MLHELKCINPFFEEIWNGNKTFDIRIKDRPYKVNDFVLLREYDGIGYLGREIKALITYILDDIQFSKKDFVVLAIKIIDKENKKDISFNSLKTRKQIHEKLDQLYQDRFALNNTIDRLENKIFYKIYEGGNETLFLNPDMDPQ